MAERPWTKTKATFKGHSYTKDGLKTNQEYEIAHRFTPENYIEVWPNHPGEQPRTYRSTREFAKHWQIKKPA